MPTSAPVTGRTIPPTPEREGTATCYGGGAKESRESKKDEKVLRRVEKEQSGGGREVRGRIKEEHYIKIQLEIKRNAASNRDTWED